MFVIGIDPGGTGGIALLTSTKIVELHPMPSDLIQKKGGKTLSPQIDIPGIAALLNTFVEKASVSETELIAYLEWNSPRPGNSAQASVACGQQSLFEIACYDRKIPLHKIPPRTWTRKFGFESKGTDSKAEISKRYQKLCQLFPQPEITNDLKGPRGGFTGKDGMIDAVFIAYQHFV
jgi:hypothetical protein